ncbi:MAG TPA: trypsin-like serine protease [Oligoflexus sp.]|uniref:S1 family peptidase n=1 Tax=Oligoflexus sp. TaxID=1971216 RepID=UPI002D23F29A|nr:trypsin-like serine protease [Oligoflexus sp.]HYX35668.1 trypsin-like serine protease [Oligoflexus sp.]
MIMKKSKTLPVLLACLAALHALNACGQKPQKNNLDIVGGRLVTSQNTGPEKVSTVGLSGCTGTIVARDLISTAAHCVENVLQDPYALFGIDFGGNDRKVIAIESYIVNQGYSGSHNDVAMLKLAKNIPTGYAPVKLLPAGMPLNPGDAVRQAGYGTDNQDTFGTLRTVDSFYVGWSPGGTLRVENGRKAACSGDSGGPLFVQKDGEWYTAGIAATATANSQSECIGGNDYASVTQNYNMLLDMARELTGRQDPFGAGSAAPQNTPQPENLTDPQKPAEFEVVGELVEQNNVLSIQVKNISGRVVRNCEFTVTPVRNFQDDYSVSYDLTLKVNESAVNQKHDLTFQDPFASDSRLSDILKYTITKSCQE